MHTTPFPVAGPHRSASTARPLSSLLMSGLALMAGAFVLDVVVHAAPLVSVEPVAHVAGILGMVLTWSAVVIDGLRPARRA